MTLKNASLACRCYKLVIVAMALYRKCAKYADGRWRRRYSNFRNGMKRRPGESFSVFLASATTGKVVELKAPILRYFADPFIWQYQGQAYLFCEEFRHWCNKGRLRYIRLDSNLQPVTSNVIALGEGHVSFPYLIEDAGVLYMIPETREEGGIHLYRCDLFTSQWTRLKTLVPGIDAVDTVVFQHEGCWWLITSIVIAGNPDRRFLAVFFADSLLTGDWQPHPINDQKLYNTLPYGSGRNAGSIVRSKGRLFRPSQHNLRYYGAAIEWMEITKLTKEDYVECPLTDTHPLVQVCAQIPMHHITTYGSLVAWDVRSRVWTKKLNAEAKAALTMSKSHGGKLTEVVMSLL